MQCLHSSLQFHGDFRITPMTMLEAKYGPILIIARLQNFLAVHLGVRALSMCVLRYKLNVNREGTNIRVLGASGLYFRFPYEFVGKTSASCNTICWKIVGIGTDYNQLQNCIMW